MVLSVTWNKQCKEVGLEWNVGLIESWQDSERSEDETNGLKCSLVWMCFSTFTCWRFNSPDHVLMIFWRWGSLSSHWNWSRCWGWSSQSDGGTIGFRRTRRETKAGTHSLRLTTWCPQPHHGPHQTTGRCTSAMPLSFSAYGLGSQTSAFETPTYHSCFDRQRWNVRRHLIKWNLTWILQRLLQALGVARW